MTRAMAEVIGYWVVFIALGVAVAALPTTAWWWVLWIVYGLWGCICVYYKRVQSKAAVVFYAFIWLVLWFDLAAMSRGWVILGMTPATLNWIEIIVGAVGLIVFAVYLTHEKPEAPENIEARSQAAAHEGKTFTDVNDLMEDLSQRK